MASGGKVLASYNPYPDTHKLSINLLVNDHGYVITQYTEADRFRKDIYFSKDQTKAIQHFANIISVHSVSFTDQ